ncbi:hypothetical protein [Paenirhodobacter hankyongi]|nr:hypothetical protein [Sinirhodobacter hankyongi]
MRKDLNATLGRLPNTLLHDALGALSLCVTFVAVLYLPGLF